MKSNTTAKTIETVTSLRPLSVDIVNAMLDRLIPAIMEEEAEFIKKLIKQEGIKTEIKEIEEPTKNKFLTEVKACEYLGISRQKLWYLVKAGKLQKYKLSGSSTRYNLDDLNKLYIAS